MRSLTKIAAEILTIWREAPPSPNVQRFSLPYVRAMLDLSTCADNYGLEYGDMIVAYALNNLTHWRGPAAKRIKEELNLHLKEYNNAKH